MGTSTCVPPISVMVWVPPEGEALPLTAGQFGDAPRGQRTDVGAFHGGADLLVVLVGPLVQHALVRIPATAT